MIFVANMVEKMIKIQQIFFVEKIESKTRSKTQFHQKSPYRTDFRLKTARHEKSTSSENGPYSNLRYAIN